ncbi:zn-finger protein [Nitrososphaeria virus YSH_922147]|uniref:Zn-finger protein n=1 Tax=Nitrososphaeria virus YSH_922147 TaxID=3071323 RepID=A0A976UAT6_9CAUD|nr:zn-finger protein [Yangshan Harbor Nitrososphaeria virus]UVF62475.1 zn-finger protein [Nitrososphaeria virus YSH_922147]
MNKCLDKCGNDAVEGSDYCDDCNYEKCSQCHTQLYSYDDGRGGLEYLCPKCEYEDLPKFLRERFSKFRTQNICLHFEFKESCKICKYNPLPYSGTLDCNKSHDHTKGCLI